MADNEFILEAKRRQAMQKAEALRYKKPMLSELGYSEIHRGLYEIEEECADVLYWFGDDESLTAAFDGDEEEAWEFKMVIADISGNAQRLREQLNEVEWQFDDIEQDYNDCTVALIGNRYQVIGFDSYEEDYMSMTGYQQHLAETEAGVRLMRKTKKEIISTVGMCMGICFSYADLKNQFSTIQAALEILRGTNREVTQAIKDIERLYEWCEREDDWCGKEAEEFNEVLKRLPERFWIEC